VAAIHCLIANPRASAGMSTPLVRMQLTSRRVGIGQRAEPESAMAGMVIAAATAVAARSR
jgi:hypothetical protein